MLQYISTYVYTHTEHIDTLYPFAVIVDIGWS